MRGHSLAIANHSTSHLAWQLTGWSPRQAIQIALAAGRGDYRENIDSALHYLQRAIAAFDISTGYEYEKKALELVGEKPRRSKK